MLAGPNDSGKSFLVPLLQTEVNLGVIVNADEIEATLRQQPADLRLLNLGNWNVVLIRAVFRLVYTAVLVVASPPDPLSEKERGHRTGF